MTEILLLGLLAFWVALDTTAFGQVLVSQPLVAGWLAGWVGGDPAAGLGVGALLQWTWGGVLPLGGASFPWSGPGAVAAGWVAARAAGAEAVRWGGAAFPGAWPLAVALLVGWVVGETGRRAVVAIRSHRETLLAAPLEAVAAGDGARLVRWHLARGLGEGGVGALLALAGAALGWGLLAALGDRSGPPGVWVALPVLGMGVGAVLRGVVPLRGAMGTLLLGGAGAALSRWLG